MPAFEHVTLTDVLYLRRANNYSYPTPIEDMLPDQYSCGVTEQGLDTEGTWPEALIC